MSEELLVPIAPGIEIPCDIPGCEAWAEYQLRQSIPVEGREGSFIRAVCPWHVETIKRCLPPPSPVKEAPPRPTLVAQPPAITSQIAPIKSEHATTQNEGRLQRSDKTNWDAVLRKVRARIPNCLIVSITSAHGPNPDKKIIAWSHEGKKGELTVIIPDEDVIITSLFRQILHHNGESQQVIDSENVPRIEASENGKQQNNHIKLIAPSLDAYA